MTRRGERLLAAAVVLLFAAGVGAFMLWDSRDQKAFEQERTYVPPKQKLTQAATLLQEYIRVDTSNPPGNETAGATWLKSQLAMHGVESEIIESAPGRGSLYARIRGTKPGGGLLLLHHIDVVSADGKQWKRAPFGGEAIAGSIYGRGAIDMKGIGICHLLAFLDVARSGRPPEHDIVFLAVADEERRGRFGMGWLIEHRPDIFDGVAYALGEGGVTEMQAERVTYFGIEIGTTMYADVTVAAPTLEQYRAARFVLQKYVSPRHPERITPEVRQFFRDIAPARHVLGRVFADIDAAVTNGDFWRLPIPYRVLTQNTVMLEWPRQVGSEYHAVVHLLYLPDVDPQERLDWLARTIAPFGLRIVGAGEIEQPTPFSRTDTPLYARIIAEARKAFGGAAGTMILHRQLNDSRYLRRRGITCYGVQPFPVDTFESRSIHGVDERVRIDRLSAGVALTSRIVTGYAQASD